MIHNEEDSFWVNAGFFEGKTPNGKCLRAKHMHLRHARKALKLAVMREENSQSTLFLSEIALTSNGLAAWREIILLSGEIIGLGNIAFVGSLASKFIAWMKMCIEGTRGGADQYSADYGMRERPVDMKEPLLRALLEMVSCNKDTTCDSLARYVAYMCPGVIDEIDYNVSPPIINRNPTWSTNFPGKPRNVQKAATAMINGMHSSDALQAVRNAMLLCVWSYPDFVWEIMVMYVRIANMGAYFPLIMDLQWMWSIFCVITPDRSVVPCARYWGRNRVFLVMALLVICRKPCELPPLPDVGVLSSDNISRLFNPMTEIRAQEIPVELLPPAGKYDESVQAAPPNRSPPEVAREKAHPARNAGHDEYRDLLTKVIALAYMRNQSNYGVRSVFERFAEAYRHGVNEAGADIYRMTNNASSVQDVLITRDFSIIDNAPSVVSKSVVELFTKRTIPASGNAKETVVIEADIFADNIPEYFAVFRTPCDIAECLNTEGRAIVKGPYAKPIHYRGFLSAQRLRQAVDFPETWKSKSFEARKHSMMAILPPWTHGVARKPALDMTEVFALDEVAVETKIMLFIERFLMFKPVTGKVFLIYGDKVFSRDENVHPNVSWATTRKPPPLETWGAVGKFLVEHRVTLSQIFMKMKSKTIPPSVMDFYSKSAEQLRAINECETLKDAIQKLANYIFFINKE